MHLLDTVLVGLCLVGASLFLLSRYLRKQKKDPACGCSSGCKQVEEKR
ncbi:MAG: FeoB-associated Cys-rich membrane protein [Coraliomargarita sp.]